MNNMLMRSSPLYRMVLHSCEGAWDVDILLKGKNIMAIIMMVMTAIRTISVHLTPVLILILSYNEDLSRFCYVPICLKVHTSKVWHGRFESAYDY